MWVCGCVGVWVCGCVGVCVCVCVCGWVGGWVGKGQARNTRVVTSNASRLHLHRTCAPISWQQALTGATRADGARCRRTNLVGCQNDQTVLFFGFLTPKMEPLNNRSCWGGGGGCGVHPKKSGLPAQKCALSILNSKHKPMSYLSTRNVEPLDKPQAHVTNISDEDAVDFVKCLLTREPSQRMDVAEALSHRWIKARNTKGRRPSLDKDPS